jgi:hypothetical protein
MSQCCFSPGLCTRRAQRLRGSRRLLCVSRPSIYRRRGATARRAASSARGATIPSRAARSRPRFAGHSIARRSVPRGRCPTTSGRMIDNDQFAGVALGRSPARPLIAASGDDLQHGVLPFRRVAGTRWLAVKTLWFSEPSYRGPVFIRGRQLDGSAKLVFGEGPVFGRSATGASADPERRERLASVARWNVHPLHGLLRLAGGRDELQHGDRLQGDEEHELASALRPARIDGAAAFAVVVLCPRECPGESAQVEGARWVVRVDRDDVAFAR